MLYIQIIIDLFALTDGLTVVEGFAVDTVREVEVTAGPWRQLGLDTSEERRVRLEDLEYDTYLVQAGVSMESERELETRERSKRADMMRRNSEHNNTQHCVRENCQHYYWSGQPILGSDIDIKLFRSDDMSQLYLII